MQFELVRERLQALPARLPEPPAVLMPVFLDGSLDEVRLAAARDPHRRGRPAAVLALLYPDDAGEARVLLTARVPHLSSHAGEVSFPGGAADRDDADPAETALREAAEEVGLDPAQCGLRLVGALERVFIPISGFRITPVVATADRRPAFDPSPGEVARVLEPPVEAFLPDAPLELEERTIRARLVRFGVYPVAGERVWGATARMLGQLGALLATAPARPSSVVPASGGSADADGVTFRGASETDGAAVRRFLEPLAPELGRTLPPAAELLLAESAGELLGVGAWAPWQPPRRADQPRGFEGLEIEAGERPAELTLLAVAPGLRGRGLGRRLAAAIGDAARAAGYGRLLAWVPADSVAGGPATAARSFFRGTGFADLVVDRGGLARGEEDRLLLAKSLE